MVKLSLCLTKRHVTYVYGEWRYDCTRLPRHWARVSYHLHATAALSPVTALHKLNARWIPEPVWTQWRRELSPFTAPARNRTPVVQSAALSLY